VWWEKRTEKEGRGRKREGEGESGWWKNSRERVMNDRYLLRGGKKERRIERSFSNIGVLHNLFSEGGQE
jgi:hypothetical protein